MTRPARDFFDRNPKLADLSVELMPEPVGYWKGSPKTAERRADVLRQVKRVLLELTCEDVTPC